MNYDHAAVRKAYPDAVIVDDGNGVFKADGTEITIDQTLVDVARVELDKLNYQKQRTGEDGTTDTIYPDLGEQFDLLFKDIAAGTLTTSGNLYTALKAVKDKYPKPS